MRSRAFVIGFALLTAAAVGCEPIPDIRFVDDDASASDGGNGDAGGARDSSVADIGTGTDTGAASPCAGPKPGPAAVCCGSVWCVEQCDPANCQACAVKGCDADEVCCGRPAANVQCKKDRCQ